MTKLLIFPTFSLFISIGYTDISGAICEKLHQEENNDTCSIQRMKNISSILLRLFSSFGWMVYVYFYVHKDIHVFEFVVGKHQIELDFSKCLDEKYVEYLQFFILMILEFAKFFTFEFMLIVISISFVDPFIDERIRIWTIAIFLPFFNACLTFALWIFGICKTVFQKIKTKVQGLFGLF